MSAGTVVPAGTVSAAEELVAARTRSVTRAGLLAAALWFTLSAESAVRGGIHHVRDVLWFAPWCATAATLALVAVAQGRLLSRTGKAAFLAVSVSMGLVAVGQVGVVLDVDALAVFGFPTGALVWLAAMVPAGVATVRSGALPRRVGVLIAAFEPVSIVTGVLLSPVFGLDDRGDYASIGLSKGLMILLIALSARSSRR